MRENSPLIRWRDIVRICTCVDKVVRICTCEDKVQFTGKVLEQISRILESG